MKFIILILLFASISSAQITQDQIRTILELQGFPKSYIEAESEILFNKYIEASRYEADDLFIAVGWSALAGIALGSHESFTFGYTNTKWLPGFVADWYNWRPNTEAVFGKIFTWQKVWRDVDYSTTIGGYNKFKKFYGVKEFWSWETFYTYMSIFIVKNTFATFIRDKFKHGNAFYSWDFNLIFDF